MNKKVILMILDGWGKSPDPKVSAIDNANIPFINSLYKKYPSAQLRTDGLNVGLPEGQMGNSEVGHMNLGAGRIVYQDLAKINLAVANDTLAKEPVLVEAFTYAKTHNKKVLIAETAYPFTLNWNDWTNNIVGANDQLIADFPATNDGQKNYLLAIKALLKQTTNDKSKDVIENIEKNFNKKHH